MKGKRLLCRGCLALWVAASGVSAGDEPPDRVALESWARVALPATSHHPRVNAAGLTVVSGSGPLVTRAVGLADAARHKPADSRSTRFRVSSITKLFTACAVAQLWERGLLGSLSDPVNRYLKRIQLPDNHGQPITLHHLLTHSAGFDYQRRSLFSSVAASRLSGNDIEALLPGYVRPAGDWSVYSNFGGALLAVLVEDVTGQAFEDYLRREIWLPLGMTGTTLFTPLPGSELAKAYLGSMDGSLAPLALPAFSPLYALSMGVETTLDDMSRFLQMLLNHGKLGPARVLAPGTVRLMLTPRFFNHPAANGLAMLFDVAEQAPGVRLYLHSGRAPGFDSQLVLAPARNLAFFAVIAGGRPVSDTAVGAAVRALSAPRLAAEFVGKFVAPYRFQPLAPPVGEHRALRGVYLSDKRSLASGEALFDLFREPLLVRVAGAAGGYASNGQPRREVAAGVYRDSNPWAYREMYQWVGGKPVLSVYGTVILRRLQVWQRPWLLKYALAVGIGLLVAGPLVTACGLDGLQQRRLFMVSLASALCATIYPVYAWWQSRGFPGLSWQLMVGDASPLWLAFALAWLLVTLVVLQLAYCLAAWRLSLWGRSARGATRRLLYTVVVAGGLVTVAVCNALNLLVPP
jgi:CubicO group peptidase (beta-lactamase class C family)